MLAQAGKNRAFLKKSVENVCESCTVCAKFGRAKARPVASLPLSVRFNDMIAIDVHMNTELGSSVYHFHIIDV